MSGGSGTEELPAEAGAEPGNNNACAGCGGSLPAAARFWRVVWSGKKTLVSPAHHRISSRTTSGQHHYHHHYHHIVARPRLQCKYIGRRAGSVRSSRQDRAVLRREVPGDSRAEDRGSPGGAGLGAGGCNTKHLDDVLELYAADATVIRSSLPPIRSLPSIREFLFSLLEAGLGDVEMESLRTEVMGEVLWIWAAAKMLVAGCDGKRREERGKYLVVLVRQPTGDMEDLRRLLVERFGSQCAWADRRRTKGSRSPPARKVR